MSRKFKFFAVAAEGVTAAGDELYINDRMTSRLAGLDTTHSPMTEILSFNANADSPDWSGIQC